MKLSSLDPLIYSPSPIRFKSPNSPNISRSVNYSNLENEIESLLKILKDKQNELIIYKERINKMEEEKKKSEIVQKDYEQKIMQVLHTIEQLNSMISKETSEAEFWKNKYNESLSRIPSEPQQILEHRIENLINENIRLNELFQEKNLVFSFLEDLVQKSTLLVDENERLNSIIIEKNSEIELWASKTSENVKRISLLEEELNSFNENNKNSELINDKLNGKFEEVQKENANLLIETENMKNEVDELREIIELKNKDIDEIILKNEELTDKIKIYEEYEQENKENVIIIQDLQDKILAILKENQKLNKLIENLSTNHASSNAIKVETKDLQKDFLELFSKHNVEILNSKQKDRKIAELEDKLGALIFEVETLNGIIEEKNKDMKLYQELNFKVQDLINQNTHLNSQAEFWKTKCLRNNNNINIV